MNDINVMGNSDSNKIYINADIIRCVAISMVVMLHMSANSFASFGDYWMVSVVYDSLTRSSVPLFFMLSGALLLTRNEPAVIFYKKRASKIVIPLIFWSYVYLLYRKYYVGESTISLSPLTIIDGPVYYHLWFLYSLLSIYIFIPMLRYYAINATNQVKAFVLLLWFFSQSIQPFAYVIGLNLFSAIDVGFITRFIGFALLGEFLVTTNKAINWKLLLGGFIASTSATAFMTYRVSMHSGAANETWFQYHSPMVIASAICLFMLLGRFKNINPPAIKLASKLSFGIYFIHIIIMQQIAIRFVFPPHLFNTAWSAILIPFSFVVCFGVSLAICFVMSKTPIVKRVV